MNFLRHLFDEAIDARTPWLLLLSALAIAIDRSRGPEPRRARAQVFFVGVHIAMLCVDALLQVTEPNPRNEARTVAWICAGVAFVGAGSTVLFHGVLARTRVSLPRIVEDVLVGMLSVVAGVTAASRAGMNLSGLIATSAVLTAMLGFSLQDVIGNVASGLALQIDTAVGVGDWIKVNDLTGRVVEVRWRYTAIETRNWETVLLPNLLLLRNPVVVLGRREGRPRLLRRWIHFNVGWKHQPSDVIEVVTTAVRGAEIPGVAADPAPNCILLDMADTFGRYAVRYWLTDLAADDPTDSNVRTRIYFALQRADMRLAAPSQSVTVQQEAPELPAVKTERQAARRHAVLKAVGFFDELSEDEFHELALTLRYAPFTRGEVMTRQGADAHWLYLIEEGEASVRLGEDGIEREVARLTGPTVFGEMSLLTGAPRAATVIATTDVECFRLERAAFQRVMARRPELASHFASLLAQRSTALAAAREGLDAEAATRHTQRAERDLIERIRTFFRLD